MSDWRSPSEQELKLLYSILDGVMSGKDLQMPRACPICSPNRSSLHIYFHVRGTNGRGGVWIWCDNCGTYIHGSIHPPTWWRNLEAIDPKRLTAVPGYLNDLADQIDAHWATLQHDIRST